MSLSTNHPSPFVSFKPNSTTSGWMEVVLLSLSSLRPLHLRDTQPTTSSTARGQTDVRTLNIQNIHKHTTVFSEVSNFITVSHETQHLSMGCALKNNKKNNILQVQKRKKKSFRTCQHTTLQSEQENTIKPENKHGDLKICF